MAELRAVALSLDVGQHALIRGLDIAFSPGTLTAIIGPNGAGKSTLLRALAGLSAPTSGTILLNKRDLSATPSEHRAAALAYLPQARPVAWPLRVSDLVALGQFPSTRPDPETLRSALKSVDLEDFGERRIDTLSGGETTRVHCARLLVSKASVLLADEPVSALDPAQALRVMAALKTRAESGATVVAVLHDITLAAQVADRLIVLNSGQVEADGPPADILSSALLDRVYHTRSTLGSGADWPAIRFDLP